MSKQADALKAKCQKSIEHFKTEVGKLRGGRASSSLLEGVTADYYGAQTPLRQLGMINTPEPRLITIQVYDAGAVEGIEKAIRQADLGLNPAREGNLIRIPIPALTEERRKDLTKKLHKLGEETKVTMRGHRRDVIDEIKNAEKSKTISEDESRRVQEEIQKTLDKLSADIDQLITVKEKEILAV